jgi:hypothetical protein
MSAAVSVEVDRKLFVRYASYALSIVIVRRFNRQGVPGLGERHSSFDSR